MLKNNLNKENEKIIYLIKKNYIYVILVTNKTRLKDGEKETVTFDDSSMEWCEKVEHSKGEPK